MAEVTKYDDFKELGSEAAVKVHIHKEMTDRQTDRRTDGQTDGPILYIYRIYI